MIEIKLPELGDGIESGDVLEVLVSEGDVIAKDQGIVELETDKATVEVPSSHAGTVTKIHVSSGDTIRIGASMISIEAEVATEAPPAPATLAPVPKETPPAAPPIPVEQAPMPTPEQSSPVVAPTPGTTTAKAPSSDSRSDIAAGPAIRRFARELGVELSRVSGSGSNGRITRDDVLSVVRDASAAAQSSTGSTQQSSAESDDWGPIRTEKMPKIRRTIAAKMHESWETVPRVTNFDDADVTDLEQIRQSSKADYAAQGIKLTTMPFLIKSVAMALKDHPTINASVDMKAGEVIYKEYVNVGIAVDTDRGLVVPSLRNVDTLPIPGIARDLATMAEKVRSGDFGLGDLRGGTFTISNLGAIGGTYSTPIINIPEVAILLVGRSRKMPVVINDEIKIRLMMPLSLSYDHRLVDGATAARFLNDVIGYLEAPSRLLLAL
jgi:pyruvate dehydrogenase E2 component (dihydrolipoyllysine-residue acetyltransferase)